MKLAAVTLEVFVEQNMNHKFLGTPLSASLPQGNPEVWIKRLDSIFKSKIATCSFLQLLLPRNTQLLPRDYRNMYIDMDYMGEKSLVCYISYCIMVVLLFVLTKLKNVSTAIALPCYSDQKQGPGNKDSWNMGPIPIYVWEWDYSELRYPLPSVCVPGGEKMVLCPSLLCRG